MKYRQDGSLVEKKGRIENISTGGALIWIEDELPVDSGIMIRVEPNEPGDDAMEFSATLLHKLQDQGESLYGYGCSIEVVKSPAD
jgi:hypothetical protein